jgi:serine protease AprX
VSGNEPKVERLTSVIVQAQDSATAKHAVREVGGVVTHELDVIDAVGATLTEAQIANLNRSSAVRKVYADNPVKTSAGCAVSSWQGLTIGQDQVELELTNHSAATVTLSRLEVNWPVGNGRLEKAELAGVFFDGAAPAPRVTLASGWSGDVKARQMRSGETRTLKVAFEAKISAPPAEYAVRVEFTEGCSVVVSGDEEGRATDYPKQVRANKLHQRNVDGDGVGVAILDTGWWAHPKIQRGRRDQRRVLATYDAILDSTKSARDRNGHGTHIASIVGASDKLQAKKDDDDDDEDDDDEYGSDGLDRFAGMAPNASLVIVRAFGEDGGGTYADVIRGINWIVANKTRYNIRVLNCSFSAPVSSSYWEDPINQAIMKAWKAGIVVVVSAGNAGPDPMTIGVPGNVPYVITVGATTDSYTPSDPSDDRLASFSSAGPTYEGFVKPDVVAPGGHIVGIMNSTARIPKLFPRFSSPEKNLFVMSGTSQAAAIVSGIAALMIQENPGLSPDDVKCGLMSTAQAALKPDGTHAYSVFQRGAGLVNAEAAVDQRNTGCANVGLDIERDLAGTQHYGGPAGQNDSGDFIVYGDSGNGTHWTGSYSGSSGYPWSNGYPWANGYPWSSGYPWSNGFPWSNGYPWSSSSPKPSSASFSSINVWVDQQ